MEKCRCNIAQEKVEIWALHVGSKLTFKKESVNGAHWEAHVRNK